MIDKPQVISGMTTRQKVTAGVLVIVLLIILWQIYSLFAGGKSAPAPVSAPAPKNEMTGMKGNAPTPNMTPQQITPQQSTLPKPPAPTTQREAELMQLQQETQAKYLAALNELQMLKVSREIAETNQAIMAAKLATVTAEKGIVTLLTPAQPTIEPGAYARSLVNPAAAKGNVLPGQGLQQPVQQQEINYTVISVSQLNYKWGAVLGYQGNLYSVSVGDVLPPDGSVVEHIDKSGVILDKAGVKKKVSLVPII